MNLNFKIALILSFSILIIIILTYVFIITSFNKFIISHRNKIDKFIEINEKIYLQDDNDLENDEY